MSRSENVGKSTRLYVMLIERLMMPFRKSAYPIHDSEAMHHAEYTPIEQCSQYMQRSELIAREVVGSATPSYEVQARRRATSSRVDRFRG